MTTKDWILLLVPTLISVASFITSYLTYSKDASKIRLNTNYSVALNTPPSLSIEISNLGKRPTTITEAGFRPNHQTIFYLTDKDGKEVPAPAVADVKLVTDYVTIPPGEVKRVDLTLERWPNPFIHADVELITYAKDITGKYYYGAKGKYLRNITEALRKSDYRISDIPPKALDSKEFKNLPLTRDQLYPYKFSLGRSGRQNILKIRKLLTGN